MELLCILLFAVGSVSSINFGDLGQTRGILKGIHHERIGKTYFGRCKSNVGSNVETQEVAEDNSFLDMANFLEEVQLTTLSATSREDALKYFNISTAAFNFGSFAMAQESFGRAVGALESYNSRRKRAAEVEAPRVYGQIWDPEDLFNEFRRRMGDQKFDQLLHLKRKVTMAFVIDTSSSMENDMGHVREYINQLVVEQEKSGADAVYVVTTFADPNIGRSEVFLTKEGLKNFLSNLQTRVGGDCVEKTCLGILRAMYNYNFIRKGNAAMYIFTDAGSKDCERLSANIMRSFQFCKASAFFILFDSCKANIDPYYVKIAERTGGFCLLVRDNAVYNITDTVNGAFESDALICGEDTYESNSIVGQGYGPYGPTSARRNKRSIEDNRSNGHSARKSILIDDLTRDFKVYVTISPLELVDEVMLIKPSGGDRALCSEKKIQTDGNLEISKSVADNGLVFYVKARNCPCVGNWTLTYPAYADSFTYSVKSIGGYTLSFDAYFVDEVAGSRVTNYAPCLEVEEYLVIKLNQGNQVVKETLTAKLVGISGNVVHLTEQLDVDEEYQNTFVVKLVLPADIGREGFRILLEGEVLGGSKFQRLSSATFYPTASCLRLVNVDNYYALFPRARTNILLELKNNNLVDDVYTLVCSNTENYPIKVGNPQVFVPGQRRGKYIITNGPILLPAGDRAVYHVSLSMPKYLMRGKTVIVTCVVSSATDEMIEMIRLTEMDEKFYD